MLVYLLAVVTVAIGSGFVVVRRKRKGGAAQRRSTVQPRGGTGLALDRSNASPGRQSDGRQHTFPHEREAIFASRLALYGNWLPRLRTPLRTR